MLQVGDRFQTYSKACVNLLNGGQFGEGQGKVISLVDCRLTLETNDIHLCSSSQLK